MKLTRGGSLKGESEGGHSLSITKLEVGLGSNIVVTVDCTTSSWRNLSLVYHVSSKLAPDVGQQPGVIETGLRERQQIASFHFSCSDS
ncbi:hypothetical protein J6590_038347 [Homalodisca vitripennis]|nr:hypothetical protein J6590_038347 [Homalodisca vitripennis]